MSESQEVPVWNNTARLKRRLKQSGLYEEPHGEVSGGMFQGRQIIARDTPINGGVYVGSGAREAIVVDDRKHPRELNSAYQELRGRMVAEQRKPLGSRKIPVLQLVYEEAWQKLGNGQSEQELDRQIALLLRELTGSPRGVNSQGVDVKVTLNDFIGRGIGICRHRALFAGYLLERLIKEGLMQGKVSVDRNTIPNEGGHAWVRFEASNGHIFIIDPSLGYWGPIKQAPKIWSYQRPK